MDTIVYFADRSVLFTDTPPAGIPEGAVIRRPEELSRDKVVKILDTCNCCCVATPDPDAAFARFAAGFTCVEAAGGVVADAGGRQLLIRRNGRWDLPKGHLEAGERLDACAVREIAEETGITAVVERPLCTTWHAYWFPPTARWELKRTHWYALRMAGADCPTPQTEEGIEQVVWCTPAEVDKALQQTFPTIRRVFAALRGTQA